MVLFVIVFANNLVSVAITFLGTITSKAVKYESSKQYYLHQTIKQLTIVLIVHSEENVSCKN